MIIASPLRSRPAWLARASASVTAEGSQWEDDRERSSGRGDCWRWPQRTGGSLPARAGRARCRRLWAVSGGRGGGCFSGSVSRGAGAAVEVFTRSLSRSARTASVSCSSGCPCHLGSLSLRVEYSCAVCGRQHQVRLRRMGKHDAFFEKLIDPQRPRHGKLRCEPVIHVRRERVADVRVGNAVATTAGTRFPGGRFGSTIVATNVIPFVSTAGMP